jgi:predicted dehydrogenase
MAPGASEEPAGVGPDVPDRWLSRRAFAEELDMKPHLKVGVIGVGRMGERHCRVYANLRRTELVGVYDVDPALGKRVARQYDVPYFSVLDDLLACAEAVSLAVPTPYHAELAFQCLERGVHVLVEKPLTETLDQAERLAAAAEASGLVVQVGHIERFNPAYIELKNVVADLTPLALNWRRLSSYSGSNRDVDVALDLLVHDLDLALDVLGRDPDSVSASGFTAFSGQTDHVVVQLGFDGGPLVTLTASRVTEQKIRSIEVTAAEAYLEADLLNKSVVLHRRTVGEYLSNAKYRHESVVERLHVPIAEPLQLELQHFVACVLDGEPCRVPARHGLRVLRLASTVQDLCRHRRGTFAEARPSSAAARPVAVGLQ